MKSHIPQAIAALFAAAGVTLATAQTGQLTFVPEPIASAAKLDGPDAELVKSIVATLNAETSLKDSKITVQTENDTGNVILTGVTMTKAQAKKAAELVAAQAGEGKVVNAIRDSEA